MDYLVVCRKANKIWRKFMTEKYALCVRIGVLLDFPRPVKSWVIFTPKMAFLGFLAKGQKAQIIDTYCRKLGKNALVKVFAKFPLRTTARKLEKHHSIDTYISNLR